MRTGTITVNGKSAQVIFFDDSHSGRLHFLVPDDDFEQYKAVDSEFCKGLASTADVSFFDKAFTAQVVSYTTTAPVTGDIEVAISLRINY